MRARLSSGQLAERLGADLSPVQVLICAAILYAADWAFRRSGGSPFPGGLLDEAAHFTTAWLLLQGLPTARRVKLIVPALVGSVAIDLDHLPQYFGHYFLMVGTSRPATHSLGTPLVLLALALVIRRHRNVFLGLALGVMLHFFRDFAEGNGSGVPLLWPLSKHSFSYPHATYLAFMACVTAADICLGLLNRRTRLATP
jgi:hypothetical protein